MNVKPTLVFDGNCRFCQRIQIWLGNQSESSWDSVSYHDLTERELQKLHPDLTADRCQSEIQWIENGKRYPGFFGFRKILWRIRYYKFLTPILYLPFVPFLGMFLFLILKRIRSQIS